MNEFFLSCADCDKKRIIGFSFLALFLGGAFALKKLLKSKKKTEPEPESIEEEQEND
jgi:hypothetical protein